MERLTLNNPSRILWCCQDFGITPEDLARDAGINFATLELALTGAAALTYNQLSKLADFFGRGLLFFLEDSDVETAEIHSAQFRTIANQKPELPQKLRKLIERVERHRELYLSLIEDLRLDAPIFNPPDISGMTGQNVSTAVREWLELSPINTFESYREALDKKGILVIQSNGYNGKWQIPSENAILGFSLFHDQCPVIVVKKQRWPAQQVFTLFHELGHILIHKDSSIDDEADLQSHQGREQQANSFAGLTLVPDQLLSQIDIGKMPENVEDLPSWLNHWRNLWGVSTEVILRRFADSGQISWEKYNLFREWNLNNIPADQEGGNRQYRHREPKHIFGDSYVRAVFEAKNSRQISLARASRYLDDLKIRDMHLLERHLVDV